MNKLPKLLREQWQVLFIPANQDKVTLGIAGSGKTLMAIYRAKYINDLVDRCHSPQRIIFLTVNTYVNHEISEQLKDLKNVKVKTFFAYFNELISKHDQDIVDPEFNAVFPHRDRFRNSKYGNYFTSNNQYIDVKIMEQAIQELKDANPESSIFHRPGYEKLIVQEMQWMQTQGFPYNDSGKAYYDDNRVGRGSFYLLNEQRPLIYAIYQKYFTLRSKGTDNYEAKMFNFNDVYRIVPLMNIKEENQVDYIIIDEVQDVTPAMFKALNCIKSDDCKVCVFGDLSQKIYGQQTSWRQMDINTHGKVMKIKKNYRNSRQISIVAKSIIDYKHDNLDKRNRSNSNDDLAVINYIEPLTAQSRGDIPNVMNSYSATSTIITSINFAQQKNKSSIIICFNNDDIQPVSDMLTEHHIANKTKNYRSSDKFNTVYVLSINQIKGLEFDNVILYNIDTNKPSRTRDEIMNEDGSLKFREMENDEKKQYFAKLYVAVTRAHRVLTITYKGDHLDSEIKKALGEEVIYHE